MNRYFLSIFLILFSSLQASEGSILNPNEVVANELARLDGLIEATSRSLEQQKRLRQQIEQYQRLQARSNEDPEDNDLLYQLIKSAYTILEGIKGLHLETAFEPDFLSELTVLSKPALKSGIPKP